MEEKLKEFRNTPDGKLAIIAGTSFAFLLLLLGIASRGNIHPWEVFLILAILIPIMGMPVAKHLDASKWVKPVSMGATTVSVLLLFVSSCASPQGANTQVATATPVIASTPGPCINGCTAPGIVGLYQECTGKLHTYTLSRSPETILEPTSCVVVWEVKSGRVLLLNGQNKVLGEVSTENTNTALTYSFTRARAVGSSAVFQYRLVRPQ